MNISNVRLSVISQEPLVQFSKGKEIHFPSKEESRALQTGENNKKLQGYIKEI